MFVVAGVLHRDPSLSNFLFYYDADGNVIGILADWDVASSKEDLAALRDGIDEAERPEENVDVPDSPLKTAEETKSEQHSQSRDESTERRPRYRTGTGPFLALDLSASTKIVHRYRHDLESFFYILCYFCAQFRPQTSENPKPHFAYLHGWESGNTKQVYTTKYSFIYNHDGAFESLFENSDKDYLPLLDGWIWPLHEAMFRRVAELSNKLENCYGSLAPAMKRNATHLVEEYMAKFRRTIEKADALVTYEKFKEILSK